MIRMDVIYEKIKPNRNIEIPEEIMKKLHLRVGEEVELRVVDRKVLIESTKDPIESLRGMIKLDDKTIKQIIKSPEFEPL